MGPEPGWGFRNSLLPVASSRHANISGTIMSGHWVVETWLENRLPAIDLPCLNAVVNDERIRTSVVPYILTMLTFGAKD